MQSPAVVRLGLNNVQLVNSQRFRIKQGMALQLERVASVDGVAIRGWARVRYDDGTDSLLTIPEFVTSTDPTALRLARPSDVATMDGWVVDAQVSLPDEDDDVKRGEIYVKLFFEPFGPVLCNGYVFTIGPLALGVYSEPGPAGGSGHLHVVTVKAESAPVTNTNYIMPLSNSVRKVMGYAWYYLASNDAATRVLSVFIYNPLGTRVTGQTQVTAAVWQPTDLTLIADEAGVMFATEQMSGLNDDATITIEDNSADPTPFPLWSTEDMPATYVLSFDPASQHANDLDAIYVQVEEWVMP